jgi:diacylglycerol O-acyltransferase
MDRMSPLDASFLAIEDENTPMHIGNVSIFEGPPPTYGDVVRMVASKLPLVPRYRQKVRMVPLQLGRPVWVDDPHFQILYHIRHTAVPSPGSDEQLRNLAGRVFAQSLDRSKPLWEIWIVEGLQGGRWALISKVHHAMVDGVSGTDLLTVLLDHSPDVGDQDIEPWEPTREPGMVELLADTMVDGVRKPIEGVRGLPALARSPLPGGMGIGDVGRTLSTYMAMLRNKTADLNGPIGPHRRWSWAKSRLADVKEIRQSIPGTVNDVVLATITRGFRDMLMARGADVEGRVVRTLVPVSVRSAQEKGTYNNRVSGMFPDLPVGVADPVERLDIIRRQMDGLKESKSAVGGDSLVQMTGYAPPMLLALGTRLASHVPQNTINTVTTNVPGPQTPLYIQGRQMIEAYPFCPIQGRVRIAIAIFSYLGGLNFGVTADYDSVPDIELLCRGIEEGVEEYLDIARDAQRANAVASNGERRKRAASGNGQGRKQGAASDGNGQKRVAAGSARGRRRVASTNGDRAKARTETADRRTRSRRTPVPKS